MNLSITWAMVIQIALLAVNILLPAFFAMTSAQQSAISTFVSGCQLVLGFRAYSLNKDGSTAVPPPANATTNTPSEPATKG